MPISPNSVLSVHSEGHHQAPPVSMVKNQNVAIASQVAPSRTTFLLDNKNDSQLGAEPELDSSNDLIADDSSKGADPAEAEEAGLQSVSQMI